MIITLRKEQIMEQSKNNPEEDTVTYYTKFPELIPTPEPTPKEKWTRQIERLKGLFKKKDQNILPEFDKLVEEGKLYGTETELQELIRDEFRRTASYGDSEYGHNVVEGNQQGIIQKNEKPRNVGNNEHSGAEDASRDRRGSLANESRGEGSKSSKDSGRNKQYEVLGEIYGTDTELRQLFKDELGRTARSNEGYESRGEKGSSDEIQRGVQEDGQIYKQSRSERSNGQSEQDSNGRTSGLDERYDEHGNLKKGIKFFDINKDKLINRTLDWFDNTKDNVRGRQQEPKSVTKLTELTNKYNGDFRKVFSELTKEEIS